jgi:probable HAF family extracellular repeat protein
MKPTLTLIAASTMLAALAIAQPGKDPHYTVTDLGVVPDGTFSYAGVISNSGRIAGYASPADGTWRAVLWLNGQLKNIGTPGLGGQNSEAFGINLFGQASGEAQTTIKDPNGEDFCGFKALGLPSTGTTCLGFVWQDGVMTALPTLGGPNGSADSINGLGEITGYAENRAKDPSCPSPQIYQFKPVVWKQQKIHELPTYPGDPEGYALGINDFGQVVGASGSCAPFNPNSQVYLMPVHPLLWQGDGSVTHLPTLGGSGNVFGNSACAINNRGQAVGQSDVTGDTTGHGVLWQNGAAIDLGVFPGDFASLAFNINDFGQVIGTSIDGGFNLRAVLWQHPEPGNPGTPLDLNTLIPANSGLQLQLAEGLNDFGEIVGFAVQTSSGQTHGFLLTPRRP